VYILALFLFPEAPEIQKYHNSEAISLVPHEIILPVAPLTAIHCSEPLSYHNFHILSFHINISFTFSYPNILIITPSLPPNIPCAQPF
jgi:hypothetical protein